MAKLVELLLPTPEICCSSPDMGKIFSTNCTIEKTKIKKKRLERPILSKKYSSKFFSEKGGIVNMKKQVWRF